MQGIGPSEAMKIDFAPRLNLIGGDNGLGKSFLLDVAWWALTRTWASEPIRPRPRNRGFVTPGGAKAVRVPKPVPARIVFEFDAPSSKRASFESVYDLASQQWKSEGGRTQSPGLILYARVDGGFCVWDPARNFWRDAPSLGEHDPARPEAFLFDSNSVWNGLKVGGTVLCRGLLDDWVDWQKTSDPAFDQLTRILAHLSPGGTDVPLKPGTPMRLSIGDVRDMPSLAMPYGDVPIQHASAAMRRIAAMAYLLVWAFREHNRAQEFLGKKPESRITFLIDEIEAHLHPRWQRAILPAMLDVAKELAPKANVQIIATTHSPFVPLSVETLVDEKRDALWDLDLIEHGAAIIRQDVKLTRRRWEKRGDIAGWATSDLFDMKSTRSIEGEAVMRDLEALYLRSREEGARITRKELDTLEARLQAVLPELDPIFSRWRIFKESLDGRTKR